MKPPGESGGSDEAVPGDEGGGFDRMRDPTYTGDPRNDMSEALPDAPVSGHRFSARFQELVKNAHPQLPWNPGGPTRPRAGP